MTLRNIVKAAPVLRKLGRCEFSVAQLYRATKLINAVNAVILPTSGKLMEDDVVVKKIPFFETSNQDGTTVYIGSEV